MEKYNIEWPKVRSITVVNEYSDRELVLEYMRYNILYSRELNENFWFNNTLIPYVYVGMSIYLSPYNSTYILDRYEVVEVDVR